MSKGEHIEIPPVSRHRSGWTGSEAEGVDLLRVVWTLLRVETGADREQEE